MPAPDSALDTASGAAAPPSGAPPQPSEGTDRLGPPTRDPADPEPAVAPGSAGTGLLDRLVEALETGRAGPFLIEGEADAAMAQIETLGTRLGLATLHVRADTVSLGDDVVATVSGMLRDALFMRVRVLKKVFEGVLTGVRRVGPDPGPGGARVPPAVVEVDLKTDVDQRTVRLEGGFATAFWAAQAQLGQVVQIDTDQPLVVVRRDRLESEGYVAEERDLVYRVRLGDVDRHGVPPTEREAEGEGEVRGRRRPPVAPLRRPVLGTGRLPVPTLEAMRATDRWVEEQLGGKGTRLEPGVLLVTGAEDLSEQALVVLREAAQAPAAPIIVLQSPDAAVVAGWARRFPAAVRLGH